MSLKWRDMLQSYTARASGSLRDVSQTGDPFTDARELNQDDIASFSKAARRPQSMKTQEEFKRYIMTRNRYRWDRMNRDFRWVQREMRRFGLNPEDARWLLP